MSTFSEKLHEIRKERNFTQEQLSKKMNVSRQTISHWENARAIPDIDTIKHLSQVLNYNFLAEDTPGAASIQPAVQEIPAADDPAQAMPSPVSGTPSSKRRIAAAAAACAVLLICAVLAANLLPHRKPTAFEPYTREWYAQEQTPASGQAFISITPAENPVRLILFEEFDGGKGWFYNFEMKSHTDIDFTVNEITTALFHTGGLVDPQVYGGEVLTAIYGTNVIDRSQVFDFSGGFPEQPIEAVGLLITGVDAKGNELEFHGYVELSKEIAE